MVKIAMLNYNRTICEKHALKNIITICILIEMGVVVWR